MRYPERERERAGWGKKEKYNPLLRLYFLRLSVFYSLRRQSFQLVSESSKRV